MLKCNCSKYLLNCTIRGRGREGETNMRERGEDKERRTDGVRERNYALKSFMIKKNNSSSKTFTGHRIITKDKIG